MANCSFCNDLKRRPRDYRVAFDFPPEQLEIIAASQCGLCSLLYNGITTIARHVGGPSRIRHVYVWGDSIDSKGSLEVELFLNDIGSKLTLEFFTDPGKFPSRIFGKLHLLFR